MGSGCVVDGGSGWCRGGGLVGGDWKVLGLGGAMLLMVDR